MPIEYGIQIEVTEVRAISNNIDEGGRADFYAKIKIGAHPEHKTKYKEDDDHVYPHWKHMRGFEGSDFEQRIPIELKLRDDDSGIFGSPDDPIDINPETDRRNQSLALQFDPDADGDVAGHLYRAGTNTQLGTLRRQSDGCWETRTITFCGAGDTDRAELKFKARVIHVPDFRIVNVVRDASGKTRVHVQNDGGPGRLTIVGHTTMHGGGSSDDRDVHFRADEHQRITIDRDFDDVRLVEISGVDNCGNPEINTENNSFRVH